MSCIAILDTQIVLKDSFRSLSASLMTLDGEIAEAAALSERILATLQVKFGSEWENVSFIADEVKIALDKFAVDACSTCEIFTDNIKGDIIATYANASMEGTAPDFGNIENVAAAVKAEISALIARIDALTTSLPQYFADAMTAMTDFAAVVNELIAEGTEKVTAVVGDFVASVKSATSAAFNRGMTNFVNAIGPDAAKQGVPL